MSAIADKAWESEPNSLDWVDEASGYLIAMRRGPFGHWCAYVGIPKTHPWHGKDYDAPVKAPPGAMERHVDIDDIGAITLLCGSLDSVPEENIWRISVLCRCHGGLTWAADRPAGGKADGRWWFGFDCSHAGDYSPTLKRYGDADDYGDTYREVGFVRAAIAKLCEDLKAGETA